MKRILILIVILFLGWIIFDRMENLKGGVPLGLGSGAVSTEETKVSEENEVAKLDFEEKAEEIASGTSSDSEMTTVEVPNVVHVFPKDVVEKSDSLFVPEVAPVKKELKQVLYKKQATENIVKVYMYEWGIDFSKKTVSAGKVQFEVVNNGIFTHLFGFMGGETFGKVVPGETKTFTTTIAPGTLKIYSPKQIDIEHNMSENLTVTQ